MDVVRLNVGGVFFTTTRSTLRFEAGSVLEKMFGGLHTSTPLEDGAFFIDRDPRLFGAILNYLRTRRFDPRDYTRRDLNELRCENDFYKIMSFDRLLNPPGFGDWEGTFRFNDRCRRAASGANSPSKPGRLVSAAVFAPNRMSMTIRVDRVQDAMDVCMGISPLREPSGMYNTGWFVDLNSGLLIDGKTDSAPKRYLADFSRRTPVEYSLSLGADYDVEFSVDGVSKGVVFSNIADDFTEPLHLVLVMRGNPVCVELLE